MRHGTINHDLQSDNTNVNPWRIKWPLKRPPHVFKLLLWPYVKLFARHDECLYLWSCLSRKISLSYGAHKLLWITFLFVRFIDFLLNICIYFLVGGKLFKNTRHSLNDICFLIMSVFVKTYMSYKALNRVLFIPSKISP